jgi:hypothetical protein
MSALFLPVQWRSTAKKFAPICEISVKKAFVPLCG